MAKPASPAQISYVTHLLEQAGAEVPDLSKMDASEVGDLIDSLKKKRGKPVWHGNGQFSHWEKKAVTVARRFQAEMLTKSWLMGVRRGWLSLIKPKIHDWADVFRAFDQLVMFVDNLSEQVHFVRRFPQGSGTRHKNDRIWSAFKALRDALLDKKRAAAHWYEVASDSNPMNRGSFKQTDGEHMLALYKDDFASTLDVHVRARRNPAKEQWNTTRPGDITELLDNVLALLRVDAAAIEKSRALDPDGTEEVWGIPSFKEFDLYGMKVVVDDRAVTQGEIKVYIKYLDEAYERLKFKKLQKAWYGEVFIRCESCGGTNPNGANWGVGGHYIIGPNTVVVYQRPGHGVVKLLAHELGHRYWYKHMNEGQRGKFEALIKMKGKRPVRYRTPKDVWDAEAKIAAAIQELKARCLEFAAEYPSIEEPKKQKAVWDFLRAIDKLMQGPSYSVHGYTGSNVFYGACLSLIEDKEVRYDSDKLPEIIKREIVDLLGKGTTYDSFLTLLHSFDASFREGKALVLVDEMVKALDTMSAESKVFAKTVANIMRGNASVDPVSDYGASNISEAFAEAFAHYVMEDDMNQDQLESFKSVLKTASAADERVSARVALRYMLASQSKVASGDGFFSVGDFVLTGKYKNGHGRIVAFGADAKGNPTIEVEPLPKGRKKNRIMGLYKVWHDPPPALRPGGIGGTHVATEDDYDDHEYDE